MDRISTPTAPNSKTHSVNIRSFARSFSCPLVVSYYFFVEFYGQFPIFMTVCVCDVNINGYGNVVLCQPKTHHLKQYMYTKNIKLYSTTSQQEKRTTATTSTQYTCVCVYIELWKMLRWRQPNEYCRQDVNKSNRVAFPFSRRCHRHHHHNIAVPSIPPPTLTPLSSACLSVCLYHSMSILSLRRRHAA